MAVTSETVVLKEDVSGPAKKAAASVASLGSALAKLKSVGELKATGSTSKLATDANRLAAAQRAVTHELDHQLSLEARLATFSAERTRRTAVLQRQLAEKERGALAGLDMPGAGQKQSFLAAVGPLAAVLAVVTAIVAKIAEATVGLVMAGAKFAIDATTFREQSVGAFEMFARSHEEAEGLYKKAIQLAGTLGRDKTDVVTQMRHFLDQGFKKDQVDAIVRSIADMYAGRGEQGAKRLERVIQTVKAKDKLDTAAVSMLAKQGISTAAVYAELAKTTHKSVEEVRQAVKKGTIDANAGIPAILRAVEGKYGGMAAQIAGRLPGLIARAKLAFEELFSGVDLSPIKNALKTVSTVLEGPAGTTLKRSFSFFFSTVFEALFGPLKGGEGQKALSKFVVQVANLITRVGEAIKSIAPELRQVFGLLLDVGGTGLDGIAKTVKTIAPYMKALFGGMVTGFGEAWQAIKAVGGGFAKALGLGDVGKSQALIAFFGAVGRGIAYIVTILGVLVAAAGAAVASVAAVPGGLATLVTGIIGWLGGAIAKLAGVKDQATATAAATHAFFGAGDAASAVDTIGAAQTQPLGAEMAAGVATGIQNGQAGIVSAMVAACDAAVSSARSKLQIASPSRVFAGIGRNLAAGMVLGIAAGSPGVAHASASMAGGAVTAAAGVPADDDGGGSSGGGGIVVPAASSTRTTNVTSNVQLTNHLALPDNATADEAASLGQAASDASYEQFRGHMTNYWRELSEQ